jgi:hypothetical protein
VICDLVKFYEGGLSFDYAEQLSLWRLHQLKVNAGKIAKEMKEATDGV